MSGYFEGKRTDEQIATTTQQHASATHYVQKTDSVNGFFGPGFITDVPGYEGSFSCL
jgi:hypothetical protein